jgi:predicted membrane chloride channel (bestrophin family)
MRFWEARTLWGNITHNTRNLVGALLLYGSSSSQSSSNGNDNDNTNKNNNNSNNNNNPNNNNRRKYRDGAIRWGTSFCVSCKHFIRSNHDYPINEFAGFLSHDQIVQLQDSNHSPLFAASMCRHYLSKMFHIDHTTPPGLAHAYTIRLQECEKYVSSLVEQVSGMEKIRSTPLPIAYTTHLRTFLFAYCILLPYIWVGEWSWATIPLCAFTAFALFGIEGASSEVEIPFRKERPNHLAMDAYCLVIMDSVLGLVVHDANMHIQGGVTEYDDYDTDEDDDDDDDDDDDNNNCDGDANKMNHHTMMNEDNVDDVAV